MMFVYYLEKYLEARESLKGHNNSVGSPEFKKALIKFAEARSLLDKFIRSLEEEIDMKEDRE